LNCLRHGSRNSNFCQRFSFPSHHFNIAVIVNHWQTDDVLVLTELKSHLGVDRRHEIHVILKANFLSLHDLALVVNVPQTQNGFNERVSTLSFHEDDLLVRVCNITLLCKLFLSWTLLQILRMLCKIVNLILMKINGLLFKNAMWV
jgi:hypothetical protein